MLCALYKVSVGAARRRHRYLNSQRLLASFPTDNRLLVKETIWHNVLLAVTILREFPVL